MIIFWILAAGLIGLALLFVMPPLVFERTKVEDVDRDALNLAVFRQQLEELDNDLATGELGQEQYDAARRDLERELLRDVGQDTAPETATEPGRGRWAALVLGLAIPIAAVSLYLFQGNAGVIPELEASAGNQSATAQSGAMPPGHPAVGNGPATSLDVLVQRLAEHMQKNPNDLKGWIMLGRTYTVLQQPERAVSALEKAYALAPKQPEVLTAYAEALAASNGNRLEGRPAKLIKTALQLDPQSVSAHWLSGLVSFQKGDFKGAASEWEGMLARFDPQGQEAAQLRRFVNEARRRAGVPPIEASAGAPMQVAEAGGPASGPMPRDEGAAQANPAAKLTVEVALDPALAAKADPQETVFIYAKAVSGPPMPLAVQRVHVSQLPLTVALDDSMAMMPAMRLSAFPQITVGARISKSGQAIPQSGDLQGEVSPVKPGRTEPVKIVINSVHP
jgi:cytochrome c-type biogenesis protein CcmH